MTLTALDNDSLRIGILAPPWVPVPPEAYGGTESVVDRLAKGIEKAGHEVRLWATGDSTCPVARGSAYPTAQTIAMGSSAIELRHTLAGYEWLADQGCDIIHDHTLVGPHLSATDLPVITTNHGPFDSPELASIYRNVPRRIPIIAISRHQASLAPVHGVHVSHVIHHGIDISEIPAGAGRGDEAGRYLLFLGRMSPAKGVLQAIDIARSAGWRLLIAAKMREAEEREFFDAVVGPRCTDGVEYVGEVGGIAKQQLIGSASALLNPIQWHEPFGLVMIEALAAGTPVIATPRGAAPEIVLDGTTGFLANTNADLTRAVHSIDDIDRSRCRLDVARRFSVEKMVDRHVAAYFQTVSVQPRRTRSPAALLSVT